MKEELTEEQKKTAEKAEDACLQARVDEAKAKAEEEAKKAKEALDKAN